MPSSLRGRAWHRLCAFFHKTHRVYGLGPHLVWHPEHRVSSVVGWDRKPKVRVKCGSGNLRLKVWSFVLCGERDEDCPLLKWLWGQWWWWWWWCVYVCMHVDTSEHLRTLMWNPQIVSPLICLHLILWNRVSHWTDSARIAGQWGPDSCLPGDYRYSIATPRFTLVVNIQTQVPVCACQTFTEWALFPDSQVSF